jgi:hypothetical protein
MKSLLTLVTCLLIHPAAIAADALSAKDLAAKLSTLQQDGSSYVRLKMSVNPPAGGGKYSLQLQIKQRRTQTSTEVIYQVLWPKERAGEAVLLRQSGKQAASGSHFTPPGTLRAIAQAQMKDSLFGSDLTYGDVLENFFSWENQAIVGTEVVDRVNCQILDSKPGKADRSRYTVVRTWVDARRFVPLRIEKYQSSGALVCRIETNDVATDDTGRSVPANLTVESPSKGSSTVLDGAKLKHGVTFTASVFTAEGLKDLSPPGSAGE